MALLQYYTDETFDYDEWDERRKSNVGESVRFQQEENESREDFSRGSVLNQSIRCMV